MLFAPEFWVCVLEEEEEEGTVAQFRGMEELVVLEAGKEG